MTRRVVAAIIDWVSRSPLVAMLISVPGCCAAWSQMARARRTWVAWRRCQVDRRKQRVIVTERGQHQAGHIRIPVPQLAAYLNAVSIRKLVVKDRYIWRGRTDPVHCLVGTASLASNDHICLVLDQIDKATSNNLVIVEDENSDGHKRSLAGNRYRCTLPKSRERRDQRPFRNRTGRQPVGWRSPSSVRYLPLSGIVSYGQHRSL